MGHMPRRADMGQGRPKVEDGRARRSAPDEVSPPVVAASLSSARNVRDGDPAASLRACLSLTSSGMSIRTVLGLNASLSATGAWRRPYGRR